MTSTNLNIISSQRFINYDIVDEKIKEIADSKEITLTVYDVGEETLDLDGQRVYVLHDGHHRRLAAIELGIEIYYQVVNHPEGLTGESLLLDQYNDSDYRYIETDITVW